MTLREQPSFGQPLQQPESERGTANAASRKAQRRAFDGASGHSRNTMEKAIQQAQAKPVQTLALLPCSWGKKIALGAPL